MPWDYALGIAASRHVTQFDTYLKFHDKYTINDIFKVIKSIMTTSFMIANTSDYRTKKLKIFTSANITQHQ